MPDPIERLAERSGLTPRTLARRFKTATGRTPIDYVQSVRVEEAKRILETEVLHTDGVSALVGYEDPASFRRMFGARVGLSPAAYRRKFARVGAVAAQGRTQEMKD
jgi:transcriptional regulator GlxA family with amidase domain